MANCVGNGQSEAGKNNQGAEAEAEKAVAAHTEPGSHVIKAEGSTLNSGLDETLFCLATCCVRLKTASVCRCVLCVRRAVRRKSQLIHGMQGGSVEIYMTWCKICHCNFDKNRTRKQRTCDGIFIRKE